MVMDESPASPVDARAGQGIQIGDHGIQINYFARRSMTGRPWMAPLVTPALIHRPDLYAPALDGVLREDPTAAPSITVIEGAGGFGKTTLAAQLCHDPRVREQFTGGLLWLTVGEDASGPRLAEFVGGLCSMLSGDDGYTADPELAGGRLGKALDQRGPTLLIVDDVWRSEQLNPFTIGGRLCRRLVTTRNAGVAPRGSTTVVVDVMTAGQAMAALTQGVAGVPPGLAHKLVARTGRWPLLIGLVNAALAEQIRAGADATQAASWVLGQLARGGPAVLDLDPTHDRQSAVTATVNASLSLLSADQRERYLDLTILPEDTFMPADLLAALWGTAGGLSETQAERLRSRLARLRLVLPAWEHGVPGVRLHDVLSAYLRHTLTDDELLTKHQHLVRAAERYLPDASAADWWLMPPEPTYLWHHLPHHLTHAGRLQERDVLLSDLRWARSKIVNLGSCAAFEADLAMPSTDAARNMRRAVGAIAQVLAPTDPPTSLDASLYSYLSAIPSLEPVTADYRRHLPSPHLTPAWSMPDQPSDQVVRTLRGHTSGVRACAFSPDGSHLATASGDATVRIWDATTGAQLHELLGHRGTVSDCVFSPDGTLLATAGYDLTARLWDTTTGRQQATLTGHRELLTACAFS
ncbi:NB-ARC domain-containing protein, partial [Kitasatospora sp. MAP5-34]|uniref:NB-ARC domain-containing protein n=1 Tax=Kitasatospora sp. MAP5-34 TaxID=3035102 RepID=UPI0024732454